eukprot:6179782-Pleurochrysis_carterae.AAC.1
MITFVGAVTAGPQVAVMRENTLDFTTPSAAATAAAPFFALEGEEGEVIVRGACVFEGYEVRQTRKGRRGRFELSG